MSDSGEEICEKCKEDIDDCICYYNAILDIPGFVKRRNTQIFKEKRCKLTELLQISHFFVMELEHMPNVYHTRSGHEVEDVGYGGYSDHDAARFLGTLIVSEYNEIIVNLSIGSYVSAIRGTRNLFEWLVRTLACISDAYIITKRLEDKNRPSCFHVISEAFSITQDKISMGSDKRKKFEQEIREKRKKGEIDEKVEAIYLSNIGAGATKFIESFNENILKYIKLYGVEKKVAKKQILRTIYQELSEYVHTSTSRLMKIEQNEGKAFFDQCEFDEAYNAIMITTDLICYFYFILLDIDVFHTIDNWKVQWRNGIMERFNALLLPRDKFQSTKTLLNSKVWKSNPPIELVSLNVSRDSSG